VNSVEIGSLVQKTKQCTPVDLSRPTFRYIDISSIDRQSKRIEEAQLICSNAAPSRAKKLLCAGDVLVSTVRPNLNAVALVPMQYDSEIASTGFCVLRPDRNLIEPAYLYYFVQTERFITRLVQLATGAGYPAVSDTEILEASIPLPALPEQERIAAQLDKADRLRRSRHYVRELSDSFLQSVFLEMFGDPVTNPHGWDVKELIDVCSKVTDGTHHMPKTIEEGIPILRALNIKDGRIDISDVKYISPDDYSKIEKRSPLDFGDVLLTCLGTVGNTTIFNMNRATTAVRNIAILKPNRLLIKPEFLLHMLRTDYLQTQIQMRTRQSSQGALYLGKIQQLKIVLPPKEQQERFSAVVQTMERLRIQQREAERQAEHLFQTLLHRAFSDNTLQVDKAT